MNEELAECVPRHALGCSLEFLCSLALACECDVRLSALDLIMDEPACRGDRSDHRMILAANSRHHSKCGLSFSAAAACSHECECEWSLIDEHSCVSTQQRAHIPTPRSTLVF